MTQTVKVKTCNADGTAQVLHIRQSACSGDCHKCSGCGAVQEKMLLTVSNQIGAQPGDVVEIEAGTGSVMAAAAIMYVLPLVLFFAGYLMGALLWGRGPLTGCIAFAAGVGISVVYDRFLAKKQQEMYTIVGYAPQSVQDYE